MVSMIMTQEGATALFFASQEGHVAVVRLLLKKGADVNICNKVVTPFLIIYVYIGVPLPNNHKFSTVNWGA